MMNYEQFLVAELLYRRDELLFHTVPETEVKYYQTLGKLEDEVEFLNFNIQKLRRMLELFHQGKSQQEINGIVEKEYAGLLQDHKERQSQRIQPSDLPLVSREEKEEIRELYRQIIAESSPLLYDVTTQEKEQFLQLQKAFKTWNGKYLKDHGKDLPKRDSPLGKNELKELRDQLQWELSQYYYTFPLNQQSMLENADALQFNLERLEDVYREYSFIYRNLEEEYHLKWATKLTESE